MADYGQTNIPKDLRPEADPIPLLYEGLFLHILFFRIVLIIEFFESETLKYHIISVASVV